MGNREVWPRWSTRRRLVMLVVAVFLLVGVIVFSSAPWWTGVVLAICLPAALYLTEAQRNMEWVGYQRCPTCRGSGKVKEAGDAK